MEIRLTAKIIETIMPPEKKGARVRVRDLGQPGLVLTVWAGGARIWYVYKRSGGKLYEERIGPYPEWDVTNARARAAEALGAMARHEDPRAALAGRTRGGKTFGEVFDWWHETYSTPRRARPKEDRADYRRHLETPLGDRRLPAITRAELAKIHAAIGKGSGHVPANRMIKLVRAIINRAIAHDLFAGPNPAIGVELFPEVSRDRRLSVAEAASLLTAIDKAPPRLRHFLLLLLFTGARKANVLAMAWADIDESRGTWRIPKTKSGRPQVIPLEAEELAILAERRELVGGSPWVFPGEVKGEPMREPAKAWRALRAEAGIEDVRLHDLRRSLGSFMVDTGASLPMIGAALGHSSPSATAVYARMSMDPLRAAKRAALGAMTEGRG